MEVKHAVESGRKHCHSCGCIMPFARINDRHEVCTLCLRCIGCGIVLGRLSYGGCSGERQNISHAQI